MIGGIGAWTAAEFPLSTSVPQHAAGTAPRIDPALLDQVDAFVSAIPTDYYTIRPAGLGVELAGNAPVLIDVRTDGEWASGHIQGAVHIPFRDLMADQNLWPADPSTAIVVYDSPVHRSSMAMTYLRLLGYENVRTLSGGSAGWQNAGFPLVTD
jgi:rhodanese-related sulfurtransferase